MGAGAARRTDSGSNYVTQLASDNFTRADNAGLGANWTICPDDGSDGFGITSNNALVIGSHNISDQRDAYTAVLSPDDQYSEAALQAFLR